MPSIIDTETMNVDDLPGVWSPVQWELTEGERLQELDEQSTASLLWAVDVPEAVLRLFLGETAIERAFTPPKDYDSAAQGEWDSKLVTFQFKRPIRLYKLIREAERLYVEYEFGELGYWSLDIEPEKVTIQRM